jgi:hypothetical protein
MRKIIQDWADKDKTLTFIEDAKGGGCIVMCPCGNEFNTHDLEICPRCGADLLYPGWAEW